MTAKKFFAEFQAKLIAHLQEHRAEQLAELGDINIGNFDQVLAVCAALFERDARLHTDMLKAKQDLRELAEEYGLTDEEIEAIEDGGESTDN